jgi:uncharacterized membrane protein
MMPFSDAMAHAWRVLSTSFWFLPSILTLAALFIAPALVQLDEQLQASGRSIEWLSWIYGGGLQGARRLLSAIAAAMMAIATVMFSSQTTALTFIGQEYGSRLLRNSLADARNQVAFGIYISTFIYALMVLRTIHKDPDDASVPHLAISFGILLAMAGLGVLIYSMYHISQFLQSSTIINYAAKDLESTIRRLTGEPGAPASHRADTPCVEGAGIPIPAPADGYVQYVGERRLLGLCRNADCRLHIHRRVGDFVVEGTPLASLFGTPAPAERVIAQIRNTIVLGPQPSIEQDLRYAVNQLVQIALRAASTDRNDIFTISMCIDRMAGALCLLARRAPAPEEWRDAAGVLRVFTGSAGFAEALDTFVRPLRELKEISPSSIAQLLSMVGIAARCVQREEDRDLLRREAELIFESADARIDSPAGRQRVARAYDDACRALEPRLRDPALPWT